MGDETTRPTEIELLEPNHLLIVWGDGRDSLYTHRELRLACECARCVDEWSRKPLLDPDRVATEVKLVKVSPTGNYGVSLSFSDGHATGIYTYRRLRALDSQSNTTATED